MNHGIMIRDLHIICHFERSLTMYSTLEQLTKHPVFYHFAEISKIPRGSGNEKEISDYLVGFAKERNLEVIQDEALNVIIKKEATAGYENVPAIIIQGHMDMVCEKIKQQYMILKKIQLNYESLGTCYMQIKRL